MLSMQIIAYIDTSDSRRRGSPLNDVELSLWQRTTRAFPHPVYQTYPTRFLLPH